MDQSSNADLQFVGLENKTVKNGGIIIKPKSIDSNSYLDVKSTPPFIENAINNFDEPNKSSEISTFSKHVYNIVITQNYDTVYIPIIRKDYDNKHAFMVENYKSQQIQKKNLAYWLSQNEKINTKDFDVLEKSCLNNVGFEKCTSLEGVLNLYIEEDVSSNIDVVVYGESIVRIKTIGDYYKLQRAVELYFFANDKDRLYYSLDTKSKVLYIVNFLGSYRRRVL